MRDRKRNAAFCRSVKLRDDERVQLQRTVELARLLQAVLPGRRVDDKHRVHRQARALAHHRDDFLQLAHKVGRRVKTACRVNEHQVSADFLSTLDSVVANARRIAAALARNHLDVRALCPDLQLLDGGRTERVGRAEDDRTAFVDGLFRYLADRGGFARTVDAHEKHERRIAA